MAETSRPKRASEAVATLADLSDFQNRIDDEFRGIRRDIQDFQREISAIIARRTETNWGTILTAVTVALVIAGMGGALVSNLIGSESAMRRLENIELKEQDTRTQQLLDLVSERELEDSYSRGQSDQKFETLQGAIRSAIENREDIDAKHIAAQESIRKKIDQVEHSLDNGLGRRIEEKTMPMVERLIALERKVFGDRFNHRDFDRK